MIHILAQQSLKTHTTVSKITWSSRSFCSTVHPQTWDTWPPPYLPHTVKDRWPVCKHFWEVRRATSTSWTDTCSDLGWPTTAIHPSYILPPTLTLGLTRITWELIFCLIYSAQTPENIDECTKNGRWTHEEWTTNTNKTEALQMLNGIVEYKPHFPFCSKS